MSTKIRIHYETHAYKIRMFFFLLVAFLSGYFYTLAAVRTHRIFRDLRNVWVSLLLYNIFNCAKIVFLPDSYTFDITITYRGEMLMPHTLSLSTSTERIMAIPNSVRNKHSNITTKKPLTITQTPLAVVSEITNLIHRCSALWCPRKWGNQLTGIYQV